MKNASRTNAILIALALAAAFLAAEFMKPAASASVDASSIDLQQQIPSLFADWKMAPNQHQVIQENDAKGGTRTYSQVLSRTYANAKGEAIMLSIAYGVNQNREETQVHRPEICYRAQGFNVEALRDETLRIGAHHITVRRVLTQRGHRIEPLSYWVTAGEQSMLPGISRKLAQLRLSLSGGVVDGMLLRVSSIGGDESRAFTVQDIFLRDLAATMKPTVRKKYFGF